MEQNKNELKVVRYGGRLNPIYEEIGTIDLSYVEVDYNSDKEVCINIEDLMAFVNRKR